MNTLQLRLVPFEFNGHCSMVGEFFIDDTPLAKWFGEERHLGNCGTNLTGGLTFVQDFIRQLAGELVPYNAFDTKRAVLYRCHCGCDDCGVISCEIVVSDTLMQWKNVTCEEYKSIGVAYHDDGNPFHAKKLNFEFDKTAYLAELQRFMVDLK